MCINWDWQRWQNARCSECIKNFSYRNLKIRSQVRPAQLTGLCKASDVARWSATILPGRRRVSLTLSIASEQLASKGESDVVGPVLADARLQVHDPLGIGLS